MSAELDIQETIVKLLATLELDDCLSFVADLIMEKAESTAVGILMWDSDLESFEEPACFGEHKKRMKPLSEEFKDMYDDLETDSKELDLSQFSGKGKDAFETIHLERVMEDGELRAIVLVGDADEADGISEVIAKLPIARALHNAWDFSELTRENHRLRSQYEEMEDKTDMLEQQTKKLINDLTFQDSVRTKHVERERLVYWISNTVRNSVRIQEVLATTVEKISTTLGLSRCHLIHALKLDKFEVYEHHADMVESVETMYQEGHGLEFAQLALSKRNPMNFDDPTFDVEFSRKFFEQASIKSGLIVPLVMRDRALAVLILQDCVQAREWSIDDIAVLGSLADYLAVAIENAELHMEIERQAVTDGLTGVANRRAFNEALLKEFDRAKRYAQPLSLAVVDLDFLKKINDTYGHMTGDEAIRTIGYVLAQSSRSTDITARYGGEEFCVLLPNTDIEMAEQLAERLRRLIRDAQIDGPGSLSASIGVASYPIHADSPDSLFLRADEALYRAKQDGRNRVKVSTLAADGSTLETPPRKEEPKSLENPKSLVQDKSQGALTETEV